MVREGLRFRSRLDALKAERPGVAWYPYDSFANLFQLAKLLKSCGLKFEDLAAGGPLLDAGAADGALSFYFESLGYDVQAIDWPETNINRMCGIRTLASALGSSVRIREVDLDSNFDLGEKYSVALLLGLVYHLENPLRVMKRLANAARYCFVSSRVARFTPDHSLRLDGHPLAYLLDEGETNGDVTNYWIFSPAGLERAARRCGWSVMASATVGAASSDPTCADRDERMFLLLRRVE